MNEVNEMNEIKRSGLVVVVGLVAVSLFLGGCGGSRPAKFYVLNSVSSPGAGGKPSALSESAVTVGIGPVEIPDYLDRPQIVTRTAQNGLEVNQFDRWGGSMKSDFGRVLIENLSGMVPAAQMSVVPWKRGVPFQHRVAVDVGRFDVTPGESVWLKAQWTIFGPDGKTVAMARETNIKEPVAGRDYPTMVAAMSRAIGSLSQDIAGGLTTLISAKR